MLQIRQYSTAQTLASRNSSDSSFEPRESGNKVLECANSKTDFEQTVAHCNRADNFKLRETSLQIIYRCDMFTSKLKKTLFVSHYIYKMYAAHGKKPVTRSIFFNDGCRIKRLQSFLLNGGSFPSTIVLTITLTRSLLKGWFSLTTESESETES